MGTATAISTPPRPPLLALFSAEPFRIFFPLGLAAGIVGLILWPLFFWGAAETYPALVHSRLMVQGFMGGFIFGFLGTAGPRLLGARPFSGVECCTLVLLYLGSMIGHLGGGATMGDSLFLALLLTFVAVIARRTIRRVDLPPPNFVLVGLGLVSAIVGTSMMITGLAHPGYASWYKLGTLLLHEGFVLLPVLGVGAFLFPRFLANPSAMPQLDRTADGLWRRKALIAGVTGALLLASFVVESFGHVRLGSAVRFAGAALYLGGQVPRVFIPGRAPCLGQCVRASIWMLLLGLLWPVFLPGYRVAGLHLLFIGGFMLVTLAVSTRVILGHSGQGHLANRRLPFLVISGALLVVGLLARIGADFMPSMQGRGAHLIYAALLCLAAALTWGFRLVPRVLIPDPDE